MDYMKNIFFGFTIFLFPALAFAEIPIEPPKVIFENKKLASKYEQCGIKANESACEYLKESCFKNPSTCKYISLALLKKRDMDGFMNYANRGCSKDDYKSCELVLFYKKVSAYFEKIALEKFEAEKKHELDQSDPYRNVDFERSDQLSSSLMGTKPLGMKNSPSYGK